MRVRFTCEWKLAYRVDLARKNGSASGNRTRISALKGPRANLCTIAPPGSSRLHFAFDVLRASNHRGANTVGVHTLYRENIARVLQLANFRQGILRNSSVNKVDCCGAP